MPLYHLLQGYSMAIMSAADFNDLALVDMPSHRSGYGAEDQRCRPRMPDIIRLA